MHNTSKVDDEPYPNLLQEKGGTGFPYLAILDAEGDVIAPHTGPRTVEAFTKTVKAAAAYGDLKKRYEAGDKKAAAGYLQAGLDLGTLPAERARKILAGLDGLSEAETKAINQKIFGAEFSAIIQSIRSLESAVVAGKSLMAMIDKGYVPDQMQATNAWTMISYYAVDQENAELLARAIAEFKTAAKKGRFRDTNLERMENALEKLKD